MAGLLRRGSSFARIVSGLGRRSSSRVVSRSPSVFNVATAIEPDVCPTSFPSYISPWRAMTNAAAKETYNRHRQILPMGLIEPYVAVDAWVAPNATIIGAVEVLDRSTVWYGCVLRGDLNAIIVEPYACIMEKTMVQSASSNLLGFSAITTIGKYSVVGAQSTLRSCTIDDEALVGQRCVIMEGSVVEKNAVLADGSVVPPGRVIPGGQLWAGNPARFVRTLTEDEITEIPKLAEKINAMAEEHSAEFLPYSTAYLEVERLQKKLLQL